MARIFFSRDQVSYSPFKMIDQIVLNLLLINRYGSRLATSARCAALSTET
jgi:hypothetical protein